jgi:hypothetical protein
MMFRPLAAAVLLSAAFSASASADQVLILGDSHTVGPFGQSLDASFKALGYETEVGAVCGASASWWLGPHRQNLSVCYYLHEYGVASQPQQGAPPAFPPTADQLLAIPPDIVIIALGSNPDGAAAAATGAAAEKLLALLPPSARCFWIGPPPMPDRLTEISAVYDELPAAFARASRSCKLIQTIHDKMIRAEDAAKNDHFYGAPATYWGRKAAAAIIDGIRASDPAFKTPIERRR